MALHKFLIVSLIFTTNLLMGDALHCYQCGEYNEGVGSITPCTNYSVHLAHLHLKECPKTKDSYCVKYVTGMSIVRDCVAHCVEKEIWEAKTYCCNTDGCNGSNSIAIPSFISILLPIIFIVIAITRIH